MDEDVGYGEVYYSHKRTGELIYTSDKEAKPFDDTEHYSLP